MRNRRRVFCILLAAAVMLSMIPGFSFADGTKYIRTVAVNNGTVSVNGSAYMSEVPMYYGEGTELTMKAQPGDGFYLKCWSTNPGGNPVLSKDLTYTYTVGEDQYQWVYAVFQSTQFQPMYTKAVNLNGGSYQGSQTQWMENVPDQSYVSLTYSDIQKITPPDGKVYDSVTVNGQPYTLGSGYKVDGSDVTFKIIWKDKPVWSMTADTHDVDFGTLLSGKISEADYRKVAFTNNGNQDINIVPQSKNSYFYLAPGTLTLAPGESGIFFIKPNQITPGGDYSFDINFKGCRTDSTDSMVLSIVRVKAKVLDETALKNPFVDVYPSDEYYFPVVWAYYHEPLITNGIDAAHFAPKNTVKRCESVTFLWRAMGCPEPKSTYNPFVDVPAGQYYYKPVLWAVENGITNGTDANHFTPEQTLTTAHMITFLYRAKTGKVLQGWYEEAAGWAGEDYGGKPFGVNLKVDNATDCPRGAVVTFLYRCPDQQDLKPTHTVITNALNVREGPGSDYSRIGGVTAGKEVIVVDIIGEWSKIEYGYGYGWVQSKYLKYLA